MHHVLALNSGDCSNAPLGSDFFCVFGFSGHCPHDEVPEDVNLILTTWLKEGSLKERQKSQISSLVENGSVNGSAKANPAKEPVQSFGEEANGVVPDALVRLKEEVEELV